jgi:hypothetical protein
VFGRRSRHERGPRRPDRVTDATATLDRPATKADVEHLRRFAVAHPGSEAYLEPATKVTGVTVVLVAPSGEWTRRRVGDAAAARAFSRKSAVPLHDVTVTSYPPRMRAWNEARKSAEQTRTPGLRSPSV